ncbi:MAG: hypothetical protein HYW06_01755 [Gemmatimonadetes bacterium]|nr:hypothetical protein [Gemmatimonadota bacterium]
MIRPPTQPGQNYPAHRAPRTPFALGLAVWLAGWGRPAMLSAQADTTSLHATLRGWEEETWLQLLDRSGAGGGRLSRNGILQRFDPQRRSCRWAGPGPPRYGSTRTTGLSCTAT